jgi:hypothetical protein
MTHTPAPWHADEHMRIVGANGDVICDVDPFDVLDAAQANLRLIAAAPDLLKIAYGFLSGPVPSIEEVRAVIRKAEAA